jgi:hypothetical protein
MVKNKARVDSVEDLTAARASEIPSTMISKAMKSLEKSNKAFKKAVSVGLSLSGTGSGKVPLLLPQWPATLESEDASQNTM